MVAEGAPNQPPCRSQSWEQQAGSRPARGTALATLRSWLLAPAGLPTRGGGGPVRSQPVSAEWGLPGPPLTGFPFTAVAGPLPVVGRQPLGATEERPYKNNSESIPGGEQVS